jgi:uncharacterized protein
MRIVVDTNVFISALLWGGKPQQILKIAEEGKIKLIVSEEIRAELERKLTTKKQLVERLAVIEKKLLLC